MHAIIIFDQKQKELPPDRAFLETQQTNDFLEIEDGDDCRRSKDREKDLSPRRRFLP